MKRPILDGISEILAGTITKLVRNARERREEHCPKCLRYVPTRPFDARWEVPLSDVAMISIPIEMHQCIACGHRFVTRAFIAKLVSRFGAKRVLQWFTTSPKSQIK